METILNEKNEKIFQCINCHFKCTYISDWNRHISTDKHKRKQKFQKGSDCTEKNESIDYLCLCGKNTTVNQVYGSISKNVKLNLLQIKRT